MSGIVIHLPEVKAEKYFEIEVKVNGKQKKYHYRVEIFDWQSCRQGEERAVCLKNMLEQYDKDWQLINIGEATEDYIHLTFRQKQ